jgi:hypothetical protein
MSGNPIDNGYITVAIRHSAFVEDYPNGLIETYLAHASAGLVVVHCSVWKNREDADNDKRADGTGMASMPIPGPTTFTKNSEVENAETSALGRALAAIGYHAKETMASQDEIDMKREEVPEHRSSTRKGARPLIEPEEQAEVRAEVDMREQRAIIMNWGIKVFGGRTETLEFLNKEFGIKAGKDIKPDMVDGIKTVIAMHAAANAKDTGEESE